MTLRIAVDRDRCEANGVCVRLAPSVFRLDEEDELHLLHVEVPEDQAEAVGRAVERCPKQALSLET